MDCICGFPSKINLEVTNICNHACIFCAHSKCTKKQMLIDKEFAFRIIKDAYELGAREIGFYLCGEPLVNPDLEEYIRYSKELGYEYTFITTNGALLDLDRFISLSTAGLDSIKFSINAANESDYKLVHGRDDYNKVISNVIAAAEYRKNYGLKVKMSVSTIITRLTKKAGDDLKKKLGDYVDEIIVNKCVNQGGLMSEINDTLALDDRSNGIALGGNGNTICTLPFKNLYVSCDGFLTVCCTDFQNYLAVADLKKDSLEKAWNNNKICEIRRRHIEHRLEGTMCYNCIFNCNTQVEPLMHESSFPVDWICWTTIDDINERLSEHTKRDRNE